MSDDAGVASSACGAIGIRKDVVVVMRDGVELRADVYSPAGARDAMTILIRTPYSKDSPPLTGWINVMRAVAAGFVVVIQDTRGRYRSEGAFTPFLDEAADGADTVAWVRGQEWSDGSVVMAGGSYVGATQWLAARERPEGLIGIAPAVTSHAFADPWITAGGSLQSGFLWNWLLDVLAPDLIARAADPRDRETLVRRLRHLRGERMPQTSGELMAALATLTRDVTRWSSVAEQADTADPGRSWVPALIVGGWYDIFLSGTLRSFGRSRTERHPRTRMVIGPWAHGVTGGAFPEAAFGFEASVEAADLTGRTLRWYEGLRGDDPALAPVTLFIIGADEWREFDDWPPTGFAPLALLLGGEDASPGRLSEADAATSRRPLIRNPDSPVPTVGGRTYLPGLYVAANAGPRDQRDVEARSDVVVFTSSPVERDAEIVGPVSATLWVEAPTRVTVVAKMTRVLEGGRSELLCEGSRVVAGDPAAGAREVDVDLAGTGVRLARGQRVRLDIALSDFPRLAVEEGAASAVLHLGPKTPSRLHLFVRDWWTPTRGVD